MTVAVIGCGAWATTVAKILAEAGHSVLIWCHRPEYETAINALHENTVALPKISLPNQLKATCSMTELNQASSIIVGVPSQHLLPTLKQLSESVSSKSPILSLIKGIPGSSVQFATDHIQSVYPTHPVAVLSGPNLANEVALGLPAAAVIASAQKQVALHFQNLFKKTALRTYSSQDIRGVELAGMFKNVVACAAGMADGLELGMNAKSALVTRSIQELVMLSTHLGGEISTFYGLAGIGDLMATSFSPKSRNWKAGYALATTGHFQPTGSTVAEGIRTALFLTDYAKKLSIDLPITSEVAAVIQGIKNAKDAVQSLLSRSLKSEF